MLCSAVRLQGHHEAYLVTLDGKQCVAKFARHPYPLKVHKCWAGRGLMPELRTRPNGNEVTYVPGGWSLVYMDYLSPSDGWKTLHEWKTHLLLSGSLVYCRNLQTQVDALGAPLLYTLHVAAVV